MMMSKFVAYNDHVTSKIGEALAAAGARSVQSIRGRVKTAPPATPVSSQTARVLDRPVGTCAQRRVLRGPPSSGPLRPPFRSSRDKEILHATGSCGMYDC